MAEKNVSPHEYDEDPEQCVGKLMKDPWNDETQEDWPQGEVKPDRDGFEPEIIESDEDGFEPEIIESDEDGFEPEVH